MYPNSDPGMFWVAFYGCLLAEVIPVPIEVPLSRQVNIPLHSYVVAHRYINMSIHSARCLFLVVTRCALTFPDLSLSSQDAGSQQIGFLLGSCGVSLALTSEVCLKGLPKTPNGEIIQFKGQQD